MAWWAMTSGKEQDGASEGVEMSSTVHLPCTRAISRKSEVEHNLESRVTWSLLLDSVLGCEVWKVHLLQGVGR